MGREGIGKGELCLRRVSGRGLGVGARVYEWPLCCYTEDSEEIEREDLPDCAATNDTPLYVIYIIRKYKDRR